jgi:hypothetical protein
MRPIAIVVVLLALLAPASTGAAPLAVKRQQEGDAIWLVATGVKNHFTGYYASAHLDEPDGGGDFSWDSASIGKGRCVREKDKFGTSTSCTFTGWAQGTASENFTMDPLMEEAELKLDRKGETFRVRWTGNDLAFYEAGEGCMSSDDEEPREGHGGGLLRFAKAEGDIYGEHVISKGTFGAMLSSGAMVTQCTRFDALSRLGPGEKIRVTL